MNLYFLIPIYKVLALHQLTLLDKGLVNNQDWQFKVETMWKRLFRHKLAVGF
jgi:hypothetical protein